MECYRPRASGGRRESFLDPVLQSWLQGSEFKDKFQLIAQDESFLFVVRDIEENCLLLTYEFLGHIGVIQFRTVWSTEKTRDAQQRVFSDSADDFHV